MIKRVTIIIPFMISVLSCGCAGSLRKRAALADSQPARIAITPIKVSAKVRSWRVLSSEPKPSDEKVAIQPEISSAALAIRINLERELAGSGRFQIVPDTTSADVVLELDLSGYGRIKPRWLAYILGTSVMEGVVKGLLVAQVGGTWPAVGVGVEEILEETIEYGGGSYLFARAFTPVTLEARLREGRRTLWRKWIFVASNKQALKTYPESMRHDRALRLALNAQKATDELAKQLIKRW